MIYLKDTESSLWPTISPTISTSPTELPTIYLVHNNEAGNIYSICGNGTRGYTGDDGQAIHAEINGPQSIVLGSDKDQDHIADNIYFSDYNNVVRRFSQYTGFIHTVVGTGDIGYTGDGGLASSKINSLSCYVSYVY